MSTLHSHIMRSLVCAIALSLAMPADARISLSSLFGKKKKKGKDTTERVDSATPPAITVISIIDATTPGPVSPDTIAAEPIAVEAIEVPPTLPPQATQPSDTKDKKQKKHDKKHRKDKKKDVPEVTTFDMVEYRRLAQSTAIAGDPLVDVDRMYRFVKRHNSNFDRNIAEAFYRIGQIYGIRGDVALCQAIIETGWFTFSGGTAVRPHQHNYCGLGVTSLGMTGHSFKSIDEGVTAQIQHLYAYAFTNSLPNGEKLIDPRFKFVKRGIAPTWHDLSKRWAANPNYGQHILKLYAEMAEFELND